MVHFGSSLSIASPSLTAVALPTAPAARRLRPVDGVAFLPAALEIVETPPSPIGRAIALTVIAAFCAALAWASLGKVDIIAAAQGKIIPSGRSKIVQPFEIGAVRAIHVKDGQTVKAGDVLIELDPTRSENVYGKWSTVKRGGSMSETRAIQPNQEEYLPQQIQQRFVWSFKGRKWWSFLTHGATVLIVIFSSTSAVLSQEADIELLFLSGKNWATTLSLLVTIISTIQSKLAFERKWIANRITHSALVCLDIDRNEGAPPSELATKLKDIVTKHDQTITSG